MIHAKEDGRTDCSDLKGYWLEDETCNWSLLVLAQVSGPDMT